MYEKLNQNDELLVMSGQTCVPILPMMIVEILSGNDLPIPCILQANDENLNSRFGSYFVLMKISEIHSLSQTQPHLDENGKNNHSLCLKYLQKSCDFPFRHFMENSLNK